MLTPKKSEVPASPDILTAPPKGQDNVKRLNKKPLMIGGAAFALVGLVMVYTLNERSHRGDRPQSPAAAAKTKGGASQALPPEFLKDAPSGVAPTAGGYGELPVLIEGPEAQLFQASDTTAPPPPYTVQQNVAGPVAQSRYASEWDAYHQARQAQGQARYERATNAIAAPSAVEVEQRQSRGGPAQSPASVGPGGGMAMSGPTSGGSASIPARREGAPDLNRQDDKRAFLETSGGRNPYAAGRVESAVSQNEIKAGTVIPIVLTTGVNSDLPGQITAQVTRNVFDTATGRRLLIPQGARLVGVYDSSVTAGQSRVLVAWNRVIYPDGSSIDLGSMPGADAAGYAGLRDRVNNHYARTFGSALFLSVFSAGVQLSQPQTTNGENQSASQTVAAQLGQQLGQLGMETARRNMQIQPTLMLRPGLNMNVQVTQDLILREWRAR